MVEAVTATSSKVGQSLDSDSEAFYSVSTEWEHSALQSKRHDSGVFAVDVREGEQVEFSAQCICGFFICFGQQDS